MIGLDQEQSDTIVRSYEPVLAEIEERIAASPRDQWHPQAAALSELRNTVLQGTDEWFKQRESKITASLVHDIIGERPGAEAAAFRRKVGIDTRTFTSNIMQHGHTFEPVALARYYQSTGRLPLDNFPCIEHRDYPYMGASPDFITTCGIVGEIKCPPRRTIVPGEVPAHYIPQVQFQLEVFDLPIAHFVQYKPPLRHPIDGSVVKEEVFDITVVPRDPEWFAKYAPKLDTFWHHVLQYRETGEVPDAYARPEKVLGKRTLSFACATKRSDSEDTTSTWDMYSAAPGGTKAVNKTPNTANNDWDMYC